MVEGDHKATAYLEDDQIVEIDLTGGLDSHRRRGGLSFYSREEVPNLLLPDETPAPNIAPKNSARVQQDSDRRRVDL